MEHRENLLGVVKKLVKYLKFVLAVCTVVVIGSIIIALLLPVYYKSSTIFLSKNADLLTERGIFGTTTRDPQPFGNNNDNDRLLTIAASDELAEYLIQKFHLYSHYEIDSTSPKAPYYIKEHFRGLYEVTKTKRDAIQLSVEDQDPELAAQMANAARIKIDSINLQLFRTQETINTMERTIAQKKQQNRILSDSIQKLRSRYGIYNTESQSELLANTVISKRAKLRSTEAKLEAFKKMRVSGARDSVAYLDARGAGLRNEIASLDTTLQKFNAGMPLVQALEEEYDQAVRQITYDKERLKQLQAANDADVSSIILVESAPVPIIKSRPVRSLLVIGSVIAAFIFSALGAFIFDAYKDVNWKEVWAKA